MCLKHITRVGHYARVPCVAPAITTRKSLSDGHADYSGSLPAHMTQVALHMLVSLRHAFCLQLHNQWLIKVMLKEPVWSSKVDEFVQLHYMKPKHEYGTII